jgi:hypothetical protein
LFGAGKNAQWAIPDDFAGKGGWLSLNHLRGDMGTIVGRTNLARRIAAAVFALGLSISPALAAAPVEPDAALPPAEAAKESPLLIYQLDTEMVVHNWVLCISQPFAEQLARAGEESTDEASAAYAGLRESRSCGQFDKLLVILRRHLYSSPEKSGHGARVFEADIRLADDWATAYVVYGSLPD